MNAVAPRWERRPATRRDELLDAATGLLQKQPLTDIKVSDITVVANTSKGTFYTYFATKEELFAALNERYLDGLVAEMGRAGSDLDNGDWFDRQDATIAAAILYMYEKDDLIEVWEREDVAADPTELFSTGFNRIASAWAVSIGEEVAAGRVHCDDPLTTAFLVAHAIDGAVVRDMLGRTGQTALGPERIIPVAQKMFRALMA
ncbi:MAG: TetR/AcrR family transcriptional regulator [Alphaproteobacteria bacterium]|jgi:AcrR family transcriptional regulator|nr:TetR/AcrR family transcriptional regulator [Rhodospirillaceae bacterium]MBT6203522.1 TetR/AcrR family transcriptional regulator [Rhodospirillaceae bacterium]MBT6512497.1 TetR/AcrR family transcriptional regulator [Rhodospirillaceae bacterium]MBT7612030.1 TetR/AcrR family transcriptional regulator [Rhodospirillaceae bacterium]MDG2481128.1 TetR/AcrR family transcriptional regulator [Alphaproteobacteria bacterium]